MADGRRPAPPTRRRPDLPPATATHRRRPRHTPVLPRVLSLSPNRESCPAPVTDRPGRTPSTASARQARQSSPRLARPPPQTTTTKAGVLPEVLGQFDDGIVGHRRTTAKQRASSPNQVSFPVSFKTACTAFGREEPLRKLPKSWRLRKFCANHRVFRIGSKPVTAAVSKGEPSPTIIAAQPFRDPSPMLRPPAVWREFFRPQGHLRGGKRKRCLE